MSLDRFRNSHPDAYNYYKGKFLSRNDKTLLHARNQLLQTHSIGFLNKLRLNALTNKIKEMEHIAKQSRDTKGFVQPQMVTKLGQLKAKYQQRSQQQEETSVVKLLTQQQIEKKFKDIVNLKQLNNEQNRRRKKKVEPLTQQQQLQLAQMRKTQFKSDLFEVVKDVVGKSRKSIESIYDEEPFSHEFNFQIRRRKSFSTVRLPAKPIEQILTSCDRELKLPPRVYTKTKV